MPELKINSMYPEQHIILFTGHMIDKPDRPNPRFPASKEGVARKAIEQKLRQATSNSQKKYFGIAGGACGGDILFHEIAWELNIPTAVYLAYPKEEFIKHSVEFANKDWVQRYHNICDRCPVHILPAPPAFPNDSSELDIWERSNRWMLDKALQNGGDHMTLVALWNGEAGDGTGGTAHMVNTTEATGGKALIIYTHEHFQL